MIFYKICYGGTYGIVEVDQSHPGTVWHQISISELSKYLHIRGFTGSEGGGGDKAPATASVYRTGGLSTLRLSQM